MPASDYHRLVVSSEPRIVIGLDPGTRILGYGVVRAEGGRLSLIAHGALRTSDGDPVERKLLSLYRGLGEVIARYQPQEAIVEEVFFSRNVKSALLLGQARGVVLLAAAAAGLPGFPYSAASIKQAVADYGRANKEQIQRAVQMLLDLDHTPEPPDAADALALAICHLNSTQRSLQPIG